MNELYGHETDDELRRSLSLMAGLYALHGQMDEANHCIDALMHVGRYIPPSVESKYCLRNVSPIQLSSLHVRHGVK